MKKLKFVLGLAGIFTLMMLSSCSNLDPFGKDTQKSNEKNYVSFTINTSPSGRFIAADSSYDITAVTTWTLSYTDEEINNSETKSIKWQKGTETTGSDTAYLTQEENGSLKVCKFPVGTYTFELEGTYTDEQKVSHTVYGKATAVEIKANTTTPISIIVGSKRTETGTGNLNLTFTKLFSDNNNYKDLSVSLVNLTKKTSEVLVRDTDYSITENSELKINKTDMPSGLYKIEITYPNYKISIDNGDCFVEIADNVTTTKSGIILSCTTKKIYYATNKESSYNGLASVSPKNLTDLLNYISGTDIEEQNISIYMVNNESPEIDIVAVNALKEKQLGKTIDIYKGTSSEKSLSISDSGIDISGELTLIPNVDKELKVNLITVSLEDAYTITLKDGTSLNIENAELSNKLTIKAIDSTTKKDNFLAYSTTPFITSKTDISNNLELSYVEPNGTQYTIVSQVSEDKTTYSYYLKPSSTSGLNVQSHTTAKITAQYENDETVYTIGENIEIPYTNENLTFSLTEIENSEVIAWYLNGETFTEGKFNPYDNNKVNPAGNNSVTCLFSVDGTPYISEFKFNLVQIKTTAVYGYNNYIYGHVKLAYVSDYTDASANDVTIKDDVGSEPTDFKWCLDENSNLWVLWDKVFYKYVSSGTDSYNITADTTIDNLKSSLIEEVTFKDIYYSNGYVYVLGISTDKIYVYQVNEEGAVLVVADSNTKNLNLGLNQIAVDKSGIIYVSTDTSIYKTSLEGSGGDSKWKDPEEFYNSLTTDFPDSSNGIKITDLQIGDGYGNDTETLYALVRDIYRDGSEIYSRGGLLSISIVDKNSKIFGYNNTNSSTSTYNKSIDYVLYSPKQDSKEEFFGPTRFCAVVPKKLVILDDGFVFVGNNEDGEVLVSKKDGFMEFDIAKESLNKCSENINAFEYWDSYKSLFGSGFDDTDYIGKQ